MSIKQKILFAISAAVIISLAGVAFTVSVQMRSAFVHNFQISSEAQLSRMESFVDLFFDNAMSTAELVAHSELIRSGLMDITSYTGSEKAIKPIGDELVGREKDMYLYLLGLTEYYHTYALAYVGNRNGGFVQAPDDTLSAGYNPPERGWYIDAVKAGKALVTEAYISDNGDTVCTVATPIPAAGGRGWDGVVGFDISLAALTEATASVPVGKTGYVLIIDNVGQVISDPKNSGPEIPEDQRWLGKTIDGLPADVSTSLMNLVKIGNGMSGDIRFQDKDWLAGVKTTGNGWSLIMFQERDEVFADAMGVTLSILAAGLGIMALMIFMAWVMARSMTRPLAVLAGAARQVAAGDLKAIPEDSKPFTGEIGVLHASLRSMVSKLADLIATANGKMKEAEDALDLSKKSLAEAEEAKKQAERARKQGVLETADQIGTIISELSSSIRSLAERADEIERRADMQRELVSAASTAINEMNIAVGDVATSTSRTAVLADEAMEQTRNGRKLVRDMIAKIASIGEHGDAMRGGLEELGKKAGDIGNIVSVITEIADQTNLLALNAAIESARAGEAGRGFAVVAGEVRKLAEKTMEATRQVDISIKGMQESTRNNVAAIQRSSDFINASTEVAHKAGAALDQIESMVENTATETRAIATASEEQSATTRELNGRTGEIAGITQEVAAGARHSSEAVRNLVELSGRLENIVHKLREE